MSKPLWALSDELLLDRVIGGFTESAHHPTYGRYGSINGSRLNLRTWQSLQVAGHISGWGRVEFTQGGLSWAVLQSASTHAGLDVADVKTRGRSLADIEDLVAAGMDCGVIIFIRGTTADNIADGMVPHGHAVMVGAQHAHPSARAQLYDRTYGYANGGAGLAGIPKANWWGPKRKPMIEWSQSRYNPANGWRP